MNDINRYIDETFPDAARPIAALDAEVARLTAELAATQAQAAAMRAALEAVAVVDEYDCPGDAPEVCGRTCLVCAVDPDIEPHEPSCALSPDAGRGWLSPEDAAPKDVEIERLTRLLREVYRQAGNSAPAEKRHVLTPGLRDDIRDVLYPKGKDTP